MNIENLPNIEGAFDEKMVEANIAFSEKDATKIHPRNNDHMVFIVKYDDW